MLLLAEPVHALQPVLAILTKPTVETGLLPEGQQDAAAKPPPVSGADTDVLEVVELLKMIVSYFLTFIESRC